MQTMMWQKLKLETFAIARFASTMVATRVFAFAQTLTIMIVLGRYSASGMAGMTLALAIGQVMVVASFSMLIGIETEVARRHGAQDKQGVARILLSGLGFAVLTGLLMAVISLLAYILLLPSLGESSKYADSLVYTLPALKMLGLGMPAFCAYLAISFYFEAIGEAKIVLFLSIFGWLVGLVCALILIPDHLHLGIGPSMGAALSLTVARVAEAALALLILLTKKPRIFANAFSKMREHFWPDAKTLLAIGVPMCLADSMTTVAVSSMTGLVGALGSQALNIYQIATHFLAMLMLIGTGVTAAITIRITNAIGAKDVQLEAITMRSGFLLLFMLDAAVILLYFLFPHAWPGFYAANADVTGHASTNQIWSILVFCIECPLILLVGIGRAKGMTARLPIIKAACFIGIALPMAFFITKHYTNPLPYLLFGLVPTVVVALAAASWQMRMMLSKHPVATNTA
jgi:MATE family multidrug resistance protein